MKIFAVTVGRYYVGDEFPAPVFYAVIAGSAKTAEQRALQMAEKEFGLRVVRFTAYAETLTATKIRALHEAIERVRNEGNQYHMEWLLYHQIWRMFEKDLREQLA